MKKRVVSLLTIMALAMTLVASFAMVDENAYAASKSKKYYLPKQIDFINHNPDGYNFSYKNIKYDKFGNVKSLTTTHTGKYTFKLKYKNKKKGTLKGVTIVNGDYKYNKYYNKKGRLTKIKTPDYEYNYKYNKKGVINKVTRNGEQYYSVKKIKYHKNGFVSQATYSNGNVNKYNSQGLMTSVQEKDGSKYTYTYTKKKGKIVKVVIKCNGKKLYTCKLKYGKAKTKSVWKYSTAMDWFGMPSNARELYGKSSASGF